MIDLRTVSLSLLAAGVILPAQRGSTPTQKLSKAQQLVAELNNDDGWERAAARLVLLRSKATNPLAEAIEDAAQKGHNKLAKRVLAVLGRLGLDASEATDSVTNALDGLDEDSFNVSLDTITQITPGRDSTQMNVILTKFHTIRLSRRGHVIRGVVSVNVPKTEIDPEATVEDLLAGLKKNDPRWRDGYCQWLGQRGKKAESALTTLGQLLQNQTAKSSKGKARFVRSAAVAILHIDSTSKEAAYAYGYLILAEPFRDLRVRAARELMASPHIASATPFLVEFLRRTSADAELIRAVINGLAMVGPKAAAAIPMLEKLAGGNDEKTAAKAKSALKRIRAKGKKKAEGKKDWRS